MQIDRLTPTTTILHELGRRLARVRTQQGRSQENLAAAAGVGIATLRRIEDGRDGKLGSWLRLLVALQMEAAIDQLLPADFRSPMAEAKDARRKGARMKQAVAESRRARRQPRTPPPASGPSFVWGDERP